MGIMSSKENSLFEFGSPNHRAGARALSEEERAGLQTMADATVQLIFTEFKTKLGESSTCNQPEEERGDVSKEKEEEEEEVLTARFREFMKAGDCKQSFEAMEDCVKVTQSIIECKHRLPMLMLCMDAFSDYYQPIIAVAETVVEKLATDAEALCLSQQEVAEKED